MKLQRDFRNALTLLGFLLVLTGCQSLGTEPAQTFSQRLAYAVGVHTAVLQAATSSVEAGTLSADDAQNVLKKADDAKVILDAAKAAHDAGDEAGADSKLATALTALTALQDYLRSHGAHP